MAIKLIAAVSKEYGLGYENELLFNIKEDMQQFKDKTKGHFVLMGRKTFESLPGVLKNRVNVVLTRNKDMKHPPEVYVIDSVEHVLNHYYSGEQEKDIWVIGGSEVYKAFLPYADEVHLTHIDKSVEQVDTYFPKDDLKEHFEIKEYSDWKYSEEEECFYTFVTYQHK